jgi:hypothetical protein
LEIPAMADFSVRKFNWVASPTAWQQNQAWRDRQQQIREDFVSASTDAGSNFFGASTTLSTGLSSIAANMANKRVQQAYTAALRKVYGG